MRYPYSYTVEVEPWMLELSPEELEERISLRLTNLDILPENITYRFNGRDVGTLPFTGTVLNIIDGKTQYATAPR